MIRFCFVISMLCFCIPGLADNLFIDRVNSHQVTDKELADASTQLKAHKDIQLKTDLNVNPFHHRVENHALPKQDFCLNCHLDKPHQDNELNRSFLNMHSNYISCETCHVNTEGLDMEYQWLAYDYPNTGKIIDVSNSIHTQVDKSKTSLLPRPGLKIAPVYQGQVLVVFKDDPFSSEVKQQWKNSTDEEKAKLKVKLHAPLNEKGVNCQHCHDEKQKLLDYAYLGASEKLTHSITNNSIAHFFTRYKKKGDRLKMSDLLR
jgi:hypothetical protein